MYVSLFNLSILWNLSQNRHSIVLELVHIIEANSNYAYVYGDKKWTVLYCMCVCVCVCVYLASYRMQLFATCLPEHKITSLRSICVIAHGSHVDTFLGLQMVQLFSNLLVHTWRSLFLKTMKT